jgi:hypothetical protein
MPNDEVVQELNVEQAGRGEQFAREPQVLVGGLRVATWVVVDGGEANAMRLKDRPEQLADTHARSRRGARIDMMEIEQPIATVNDGDVELLLWRPTEDRLSDCSEVRWRLHASPFCGPPGGELMCCGHGPNHEVSGVAWQSSALQPVGDVAVDEPPWPFSQGDDIACSVRCPTIREQRVERTDKLLITIALLRARIARYGRC